MIELEIRKAVQKLKASMVSTSIDGDSDPVFWNAAADILAPLEGILSPAIFETIQNRVSVALASTYEATVEA